MRKKPDYGWRVKLDNGCEVISCDFQRFKKSNPPPLNYETPVIQFPIGYFKGDIWITY